MRTAQLEFENKVYSVNLTAERSEFVATFQNQSVDDPSTLANLYSHTLALLFLERWHQNTDLLDSIDKSRDFVSALRQLYAVDCRWRDRQSRFVL